MKKLISLLFSGMLVISPIAGQDINQKGVFEKLGIPERFVGYENHWLKAQIVESYGGLYEIRDFDINGDEKKDVRESYDLVGNHPGTPFNYMFDLDEDGEFADDELWMDDLEDGLNGNEFNIFEKENNFQSSAQ